MRVRRARTMRQKPIGFRSSLPKRARVPLPGNPIRGCRSARYSLSVGKPTAAGVAGAGNFARNIIARCIHGLAGSICIN